MRLVSYIERPVDLANQGIKLGALYGEDCIVDLEVAQSWAQGALGFRGRELPPTMLDLLHTWSDVKTHVAALLAVLPGEECLELKGSGRRPVARRRADAILLPPLPNVLSLRCFSAFEKHERNLHRLHSKAIPRAWYRVPVFHYANPFTVQGPDQSLPMPRAGKWLDYGLSVAWVISRQGRNIEPEQALDYVAGYMVLNDWSLRDVEVEAVNAGFGPGKGKDFATTVGPALVTPDELAEHVEGEGPDLRYNLAMTARVNGKQRSSGNFKDLHWAVADMIAYASYDTTLYPGEMLSSGPVGSGSLFEQGAEEHDGWLRAGDMVELEVEALGRLATPILAVE